jgi:hypothetical protein
MDFESGYAVSQRIRRQFRALPLVRGDQASCRFDNESAISAPGLKKARPREVRVAAPTNRVENSTDYLWLRVDSAAAMQGLNLERHLHRSISRSGYQCYGAFGHWFPLPNVE